MTAFRFLLGEETSYQIIWLEANDQRHALAAIELLARHPFTTGLPSWTAEDGRTHYLRTVHGWVLTFWIDEADQSVRIVALDPE